MSKLYSRPRTPPTPPPFSQKSSSRSSRHDSKSYEESSKSFSSRDYSKYSSYDKYDRPKYDSKSDKYDRYDKLDKHSYKSSSYLSNKEYEQDYAPSMLKDPHSTKYVGKGNNSSYQEDSFRSKGSLYSDQSYSDRDSYLSKYPPRNSDKFSKYSPSDGKDMGGGKYSSHVMRLNLSNSSGEKKYSPYPSSKSLSYSKCPESNSYYPKGEGTYDAYESFTRRNGGREKGDDGRGYSDGGIRGSGKGYDSLDSYPGEYQRYVIGDSVVYGSPGHYPKDIYPPSPKSKRASSPHSPPPILSSSSKLGSSSKSYSRYSTSPKRYNRSSSKGASSRDPAPYSRGSNSLFRKPPSPPLHSYQGVGSQSHSKNDRSSRNYTPPPDRGKGYDDRYDMGKSGRFYDHRESGSLHDHKSHSDSMRPLGGTGGNYRRKDDPFLKPYSSSYQGDGSLRGPDHAREKYPSERHPPRPLMAPKPLLSIPLSLKNLPKESRANLRETLGLPRNRPLNGVDKAGRPRRLDGRIGSRKNAPLSPKDRKRRRPDDLRLWIESRKTEGGKSNGGGAAKGRGPVKRAVREGANRSRLMDSRRRILNKGKKKSVVRREPRRLLPAKPKARSDGDAKKSNTSEGRSRDESSVKRRKEKTKEGGGEGRDKERERERDSERGGNKGASSGRTAAAGSTANNRRQVKRPRVVSQANRITLKQRPAKRSAHRSSTDRDKASTKPDKSSQHHRSSKSKGRDRSRSRSRSPRSPRLPKSPKSPKSPRSPWSPKRSEKDDLPSSSSRH